MTSSFTSKHRYRNQGEVFFDDGREVELLQRIFSIPEPELTNKLRNNPAAILAAIDAFATERYLMNVGELKGAHVTKIISNLRPKLCIELGSYVGYSTILFGSAVKDAAAAAGEGGARYYCLEYNPVFAGIVMALVSLAGLDDVVKVVIGSSSSSLSRLAQEGVFKDGVDFMFLDHLKPLYKPDLLLSEGLGIIRVGTVLVADNMISPGNPPYHAYVNMSPAQKAAIAEEEGLEEGNPARGDPSLIYENEWIDSWEPQAVRDALEVSRCVGKVSLSS